MQLLRFFQLILPLAAPLCVFAGDPEINSQCIDDIKPISKRDFLTENFSCLNESKLGYNENHISRNKFPCLTGGIEYSYSYPNSQSRIEVRDGTNVLTAATSIGDILLKVKYPVHKLAFDLVTFGGFKTKWRVGFYDSSGMFIKQITITSSGLDNTRISYSSGDFPFTTIRITPVAGASQGSYGVTNLKWLPTWPGESEQQGRLIDSGSAQ